MKGKQGFLGLYNLLDYSEYLLITSKKHQILELQPNLITFYCIRVLLLKKNFKNIV